MTRGTRAALVLALVASTGLVTAVPAAGQAAEPVVGTTPGSHMRMLLQKTIFKVDVLTVDICFDEPTGRRIAALAGRGRPGGATADSVMHAALAGQLAVARIEFLRDVSLRDFLDGVGEDLGPPVAAGLLPDSVRRAILAALPGWYAPLERRGLRRGDVLLYELLPQTVRTVLVAADGQVLLDRSETGRARRNSPLAAWLAPRSQFRPALLQSLRTGRDARAPRPACSLPLPPRKMTSGAP